MTAKDPQIIGAVRPVLRRAVVGAMEWWAVFKIEHVQCPSHEKTGVSFEKGGL